MALLEIELDVAEEPRADPWSSYYAARFAWSDAAADVWRSVSSGSQRTEGKRLEAPQFVEVREGESRTGSLLHHALRQKPSVTFGHNPQRCAPYQGGRRSFVPSIVANGSSGYRFGLRIVPAQAVFLAPPAVSALRT